MPASLAPWRLPPILWSGVLLVLFGALWIAVTASPSLDAVDLAAVGELHRVAFEPFVEWARELTLLGGTDWIIGLTTVSVCLLAGLRYRNEAFALAVAVASTEIAVAVVKHLMLRQRPPAADAVDHAAGYSFPSGHAATTLALFGSMAFLLARSRSRRFRVAVWSAATALLLGIGVTRVYLGVHYPTDIAAGWLLAGALTTATWTRLAPSQANPPSPAAPALRDAARPRSGVAAPPASSRQVPREAAQRAPDQAVTASGRALRADSRSASGAPGRGAAKERRSPQRQPDADRRS